MGYLVSFLSDLHDKASFNNANRKSQSNVQILVNCRIHSYLYRLNYKTACSVKGFKNVLRERSNGGKSKPFIFLR